MVSVLAQPAAVRVRGTIEKVDGGTLTVKTREGDTVKVDTATGKYIERV